MEAQRDDSKHYPFRAHQQPQIAWLALIVLFFLLAVANGAPIWIGFQSVPFLTAYLTIVCFVALYVTLKFVRNGQWELVDLSKAEAVAKKIQRLNDTRYRALERGVRSSKPVSGIVDFLKSCRDKIQNPWVSRD
jgi:amino acid transporter